MTTNATYINKVMAILGSRTSTTLRAWVVHELNAKMREIENGDILPWFLVKEWSGSTAAEVETVDLPSDFVRETEDTVFYVYNEAGTKTPVEKVELDRLRETAREWGWSSSVPVGYALLGGKLYLAPVPDDVYTFKVDYYATSAVVVDDGNEAVNKWLIQAENFILLETAMQVANFHTQDLELADRVAGQLQPVRERFWKSVTAREAANQMYSIED